MLDSMSMPLSKRFIVCSLLIFVIGACFNSGELKSSLHEGKTWAEIYFKDKKIGYSFFSVYRKGADVYVSEYSYMYLKVSKQDRKMTIKIDATLYSDFSLKQFTFSLKSEGTETLIHGEIKVDGIHYKVVGSGNEKIISFRDPVWIDMSVAPFLAAKQLRVGKRFQLPIFDPMTRSVDSQLDLQVEAKERLAYMGQDIDVFKISMVYRGGSLDGSKGAMWMGPFGKVYKKHSDIGIEIRKVTRQQALNEHWDKHAPDIIAATAIPISKSLDDVARLRYLELRFKARHRSNIVLPFEDRRQKKIDSMHFALTRDSVDDLPSVSLPVRTESMQPFLLSTPFIQSNDPRIRKVAKQIIGKEQNAKKTAELLHAWVYKTLKKIPVVSMPNAVQILENKQGDCNEHTTLYTALARSIGLPARMSTGLVYQKGSFYYHAWPEVYLGKWVAIDPTLNQFPADATHIKFAEGDLSKQSALLSLVGNVDIEIIQALY